MKKIGYKDLVKIIPVIQHDDEMNNKEQYPPGLGVQQWEIIREIPIYVKGFRKKFHG